MAARRAKSKEMSSRERMLAAINHQEPDHVPLYLHFFPTFAGRIHETIPSQLRWSGQLERVQKFLGPLGIDDILSIGAPSAVDLSNTDVRVTKEQLPEEPTPILTKTYETPKGILRQVVRQTADWPHGDDVPLISDYSVPRSKEFLVKGREDIDKLRCILTEPTSQEIGRFRDEAETIRQFADRWQVLVQGQVGSVGTDGCHLVGMEGLILKVLEEPDFALELFDVLHRWETARLKVLLDAGVADVIIVNGFYESLQLWSPELYRSFFFKPFQEKIRLIQQSGARCAYNMTSRLMPLVPAFRELGFDILRYLDPLKGETDLAGLKREIGDLLCFLGGVNGAITVGLGSVDEIRRAALHAIRTLAPGGGLILSAADAIYEDAPWENVMALIDCWREAGKYPIHV